MIIVVVEKQHKQLLETRRTQQTQIVTRGCIFSNMYLTHLINDKHHPMLSSYFGHIVDSRKWQENVFFSSKLNKRLHKQLGWSHIERWCGQRTLKHLFTQSESVWEWRGFSSWISLLKLKLFERPRCSK